MNAVTTNSSDNLSKTPPTLFRLTVPPGPSPADRIALFGPLVALQADESIPKPFLAIAQVGEYRRQIEVKPGRQLFTNPPRVGYDWVLPSHFGPPSSSRKRG
jgi:hypothetical protein